MAKKATKKTAKAAKAKATPKPDSEVEQSAVVVPESSSASAKSAIKRNWLLLVVIGALIVVFVGLTYGYVSTRNQLNDLKNPAAKSNTEASKLVARISKTVDLPSGTPTLATVKDASKLKGQAFFANAKNGDKVLIYQDYNRALLYRPSTNKVIEFSQVSLSGNQ